MFGCYLFMDKLIMYFSQNSSMKLVNNSSSEFDLPSYLEMDSSVPSFFELDTTHLKKKQQI